MLGGEILGGVVLAGITIWSDTTVTQDTGLTYPVDATIEEQVGQGNVDTTASVGDID